MYAKEPERGLGSYARDSRDGLGVLPVVPVVGTVVSKLFGGISFKKPSDARARAVIPAVVASANQGNLRAVAILDTRRSIGISSERAEWARGYGQVTPSVIASYEPQRAAIVAGIPASAQSGPEAAATWALQTPVTAPQTVIEKISDVVVPAFLDTQAGREVKAAVVSSAVQSEAAKATETAKASILPLAIGAAVAFMLFKK